MHRTLARLSHNALHKELSVSQCIAHRFTSLQCMAHCLSVSMHNTHVYQSHNAQHTIGIRIHMHCTQHYTQVCLPHNVLSHVYLSQCVAHKFIYLTVPYHMCGTQVYLSHNALSHVYVSMRGTQVYVCHNVLSHVYLSQCVAHRFMYVTMSYHMIICLNVWHTSLSMSQCPIICLSVSMRGTQVYLCHNALSHVYLSQCVAHRFIYLTMCYHMFMCLNAWHTDLFISQCAIKCLSVSLCGTRVYICHNVLSNVYLSQCMAHKFTCLQMHYLMFICLNAWHTSLTVSLCTAQFLCLSGLYNRILTHIHRCTQKRNSFLVKSLF